MATVGPLNWYAEDPRIGMGLNFTVTAWTSASQSVVPELPGPGAALGDTCNGQNNSKWIFVQASSTITCGNVIYVNKSYKANNLLGNPSLGTAFGATQALSDITIAFAQFTNGSPTNIKTSSAQVVANTNDYFWALLEADAGIWVNSVNTSIKSGANAVYQSQGQLGAISTTADTTTTVSATNLINLYVNTSLDPTTSVASQVATDCFTVGRVRTSVSTTA